MRFRTFLTLFILALIIVIGFSISKNLTGNTINNQINSETKVILKTNFGDITLLLYKDTPITTNNFLKLARQNVYDGVIFHRVIERFMIQGGDPTGTGKGDPNIPNIKDEFVEGHSNLRGTISMANTGQPNSGSSQFFINLQDNTFLDFNKPPLTSKHPVFGEVIEGMEIIDKIAKVQTDSQDKPLEDVVIEDVIVL